MAVLEEMKIEFAGIIAEKMKAGCEVQLYS
jgi:hypothetical protein